MSSVAVPAVSPSPAPRTAAALRQQLEASLAERIPAAFTVYDRSTPEMAASGIAALDALTGGLPRGALSEVAGPASSGRTSLLLAALAAATTRGEACALLDVSDAFDPESAVAAGVDLDKLLWVRCGENSPRSHEDTKRIRSSVDRFIDSSEPTIPVRAAKFGNSAIRQFGNGFVPSCLRGESSSAPATRRAACARLDQALRAADLLLAGGGFPLVAIDLGDVPAEAARRVPLASWFRFRRAVENTPAVLLLVGRQPVTQSCAALVVQLQQSALSAQQSAQFGSSAIPQFGNADHWPLPTDHCSSGSSAVPQFGNAPSHAELLTGLDVRAEVARSPLRRKPACTAHAEFAAQAPWAS